jgi:hypothetical protein
MAREPDEAGQHGVSPGSGARPDRWGFGLCLTPAACPEFEGTPVTCITAEIMGCGIPSRALWFIRNSVRPYGGISRAMGIPGLPWEPHNPPAAAGGQNPILSTHRLSSGTGAPVP